jgi:hypothetical protein
MLNLFQHPAATFPARWEWDFEQVQDSALLYLAANLLLAPEAAETAARNGSGIRSESDQNCGKLRVVRKDSKGPED